MNGYLGVIGVLRADGPVGLFIGGSGVQTARVFPGNAPQEAEYPLITVETFDGEAFDTKSGAASVDHDLVRVSYFAEKDRTAGEMAEAGRDALDEYNGTINGLVIERIRYLRPDSYDINVTNKRIRVHEHEYEVRVRV